MLLTCKHHRDLVWYCKDIAYSPDANDGQGGYNGSRSIFFFGWHLPDENLGHALTKPGPDGTVIPAQECACAATELIGIPGTGTS